jgi:hypothetical protein
MVVLLGFAALALEVTGLYLQQRKMQAATDAAVLAASVPGRTVAQARGDALAIAGEYGFMEGDISNVVVTVAAIAPTTLYPLGGTEVLLQKQFRPALISLFITKDVIVRARSFSIYGRRSPGCILALDPVGAGAITIRNQSSIFNTQCEIVSNSISSEALILEIGARVFGPTFLVGNYRLGVNAAIVGTPLVINGTPPVTDPYATVQLPQAGSCTSQSATIRGTTTLNPGRFCSGMGVANNAKVTLNPGVYFIDQSLSLGNNATITGTGVTLLLNQAPQVVLAGGVTLALTPPLTGTTAGITIASQRQNSGVFSINNNAVLKVEGAIYLPGMTASISGNATTAGNKCTQIIAFRIDFASDVALQADCGGTPVRPIGNAKPVLAE